MTLLRHSLHLLLLTAGVSLFGAVPAPSFSSDGGSVTDGQAVVSLVGSKTVSDPVNNVDVGKDKILPLNFSGYSGTWDMASADAVLKRITVRVQSQDTAVNHSSYTFVYVATTGTPSDLAVADVSNKTTHTDDLITAEDGVIRIYTNTRNTATAGLPSFAAPITPLTATATDSTQLHINKIAIADFNQDGQPDIVGVGTIVVGGVNQVQVAVFLNNAIEAGAPAGVPSFKAATVYTAGFRATGDFVAVGNLSSDIVRDGHAVIDPYPEIVVAGSNGDVPANGSGGNGSGYGEFIVFHNKEDGTFGNGGEAIAPPFFGFSGHHIHALAIGDTNSDGQRDIVLETSNITNGQTLVNVFGGNAEGEPGQSMNGVSFNAATFLGTNTSRTFQGGLAIGDLNGDGIPDIASVLDTDGLHIIAMPAVPDDGPNSPGQNGFLFQAAAGTHARNVAITDANRNGAFDLAVTNEDVKAFILFLNTKAVTPTITTPSTPTFSPSAPHYGQQVTITSTYDTTVAKPRLTFQRKGLDNKWVTMGSALGTPGVVNNNTFTNIFNFKISTLPTGIYSFRTSATVGGKIVYSDESLALTVGLATPTITAFTPGKGTLPTKLTIKEAGIPGNILSSGLTFTLQTSQDGSSFTDVPNGTPPNQNITITGTNGTYIVAVKTLPTDAPYFRVVAHLDSQYDITSPNFSLFAVDATIAQVTNDTTGTDDTTQVVKAGAALGTNVINTTGVSQTKTVRIPWGDFQTFAIRFKNLSKFSESVSVNGPTGDNNFEVRYFAAAGTAQAPLIGSDITSTVTVGGFPVTNLAPGASGVVYMRVRTYPGTMRATVLHLPVTLVVGDDPARRDLVQVTVSATDALKAKFVTDGGPTGPGTLFDAITYANAHPGTTIEFEVPADDAHWTTYNGQPLLKIPCTSPLPAIKAAGTVIDGTSQRELPDQTYSATNPAICLVGYGIPDNTIGQDLPHEIGLDIEAANCSVKGLMVTRFATGVSFFTAKAINGSVFGCTFIGNTNVGVSIESHATKNTIGGPSAGQRNVFRALQENNVFYSNYGVAITDHSNSNKVQGNFFGVTETGAPEPNLTHGFLQSAVFIERSSEANLIGGTTNGTGNLISGNVGTQQEFSAGIEIRSSNNLVQGNFIGTTLDGNSKNGNAVGVLITVGVDDQGQPKLTDGVIIGSTELGGTNLISGNEIGIKSTSGVEHTRIYGNYIGTNINGLSAVPNTIGIRLHGYDSTIGGKTAAYRNVISGNSDDGILLDYDRDIDGQGTPAAQGTFNEVYGNYIGVNSINSGPLPNGGSGVETFSGGNTVGDSGPGLANIIANNTLAGVLLNGPSNLANTIRANSMYGNGGLALDVVPANASGPDGVTANDSNEADGLQNYPFLTGATKVANKNSYTLRGTLQSLANQNYVLDAYLTDTPDSSGHGEGKVYLGSVKLKSDATGHILFGVDLPIPAAALPASGKYVSMTATQLVTQSGQTFFNGTSEFSNIVTLP